MSQALLNPEIDNKFQSYQLICINASVIDSFRKKFAANNINYTLLHNSKDIYLIDAPSKLGRILSTLTNYNLFTLNNSQLFKLILLLIKNNFKIHSFEFVGEKYFDEDLTQNLELAFKNSCQVGTIVQIVERNSLEISKFKMKNQSTNITIYRSGLIHTNENRSSLTQILSTFFEDF